MKRVILSASIAIAFSIGSNTLKAASGVQSGLFFNPAFTYQESYEENGDTGEIKSSLQILNIGAGYAFEWGLFCGAKYFSDTRSVATTVKTSTTESTTTTVRTYLKGYGLNVGYLADMGLCIGASYLFLNPEKRTSSAKFYGGSAEIYDIGYRFVFGGDEYAIGPQVTMSKFTYKQTKSAGVESDLDGSWYDQDILPYISMWVFF